MDINKETLRTWNKVAPLYQEKFMDLPIYNSTYDVVCEAITTKGAKMLDIGCGPGNITKYLLTRRPDFQILGIDYAPNMIELARKNNPNASFRVMDIREIGKLQTGFHGVVCGFCLPFLSGQESIQLIQNIYNILLRDGIIYLSFVEGDPTKSGFKTGGSGDRIYFNYHQLETLQAALVMTGFSKPDVFKIAYPGSQAEEHIILIARKIFV